MLYMRSSELATFDSRPPSVHDTRSVILIPPELGGKWWGCIAETFVNRGPEHMPLGPADHLLHLQRLAARGEKDES